MPNSPFCRAADKSKLSTRSPDHLMKRSSASFRICLSGCFLEGFGGHHGSPLLAFQPSSQLPTCPWLRRSPFLLGALPSFTSPLTDISSFLGEPRRSALDAAGAKGALLAGAKLRLPRTQEQPFENVPTQVLQDFAIWMRVQIRLKEVWDCHLLLKLAHHCGCH